MAADEPTDDDLRDEQDAAEDDTPAFEAQEASRSKARVSRIRSLGQVVDEADRCARAVHEGDLARWASQDDGASFKLRLLLKQLRTLTKALQALVGEAHIES